MKSKRYIFLIMGMFISVIVNIEMLFLEAYETIEEQYMNAVFPFNIFLERKQYFMSFKLLFLSLVFLCFSVNIMNSCHIPYALLRIDNRFRWELRQTRKLVDISFLYFGGFSFMTFILSLVCCNTTMSLTTYKIWILSLIALVYHGVILACLVNCFSSIVKARTAVVLIYVLLLCFTFMTMKYADVMECSNILQYLNPIIAISIVEENNVAVLLEVFGIMILVSYLFRFFLAYRYARGEINAELAN